MDKENLRERLTPLQYKVTQEEGTEPPFNNEYWDNTEEGIYVDIVDGRPLFSSSEKYKSGTGWPSFTRPISETDIAYHDDYKLLSKRIEVRSRLADSHLGHVFSDGPEPTGLRYCLNSAALRFIPKEQMEKEGYGSWLYLFDIAGKTYREAVVAGGCFWCMEPPFERAKGVFAVIPGYTGGSRTNPTYQEVSTGQTGHYEAARIIYDPDEISYRELVDIFWKNIDPTDSYGQFADKGSHYRTALFFGNDEEKRIAEESRQRLAKSGKFSKPIVTEILPATSFYPAEEYHQDYYLKNPSHYEQYKIGSGRAGFLKDLWDE